MFFALTVSYAGAAFRFQTDMGDIFDLALSYDIDQGSTLTHTFSTTMQTVPGEGGFNTLSYIFSQDLVFDWFHVKYAAGQLAFYVRGYAELAEVLMNPYITIAGYGIGAGVVLRGLE